MLGTGGGGVAIQPAWPHTNIYHGLLHLPSTLAPFCPWFYSAFLNFFFKIDDVDVILEFQNIL